MSVRYKIILSLLLLTAVCLGIYIWIAKTVFEKDKQLAIFESASQTSTMQAHTIKQVLDDVIQFGSSLIETYQSETNSLSPFGLDLFNRRKEMIFIGVLENGDLPFVQIKGSEVAKADILGQIQAQQAQVVSMKKPGQFAILIGSKDTAATKKLVIGVDLKETLAVHKFNSNDGGTYLVLNEQPIAMEEQFPVDLAKAIVTAIPAQRNLPEQTTIEAYEGREYLVAARDVPFGGFRVFTSVPKDLAFQGLSLLYRKSVQFYGLIFFIVLIVSVYMTNSLLKNLDRLTEATDHVSKGEFDFQVGVKSKDEFGVLAGSFQKMSQEIKRLLFETREKARMESELKTAQTVQENLFPEKRFENSFIELEGLYRPASECGGDWWYYFDHPTGTYIFICDATGHGAPAALITAAAKAAVNMMRREADLDLLKMAHAFNYCLYETAKGRLLMTGFVVHVKPDRTVEYVNASHDPPMVFTGDSEIDFLLDPVGPRFGQGLDSAYGTGKLENLEGKTLILYTDGITGQKNANGKEIGDNRFTRYLIKNKLVASPLSEVNSKVFNFVDEFRGEFPQEDDLTIVTIKFR